jgi:hypothetical protein
MNRFNRDFRRGMGPGGQGFGATAPAGAPAPSSVPMQPSSAIDEADIFDPMGNGMDVIFYTTLVQGIGNASTTAISSIQIDQGIDFYWVASTYMADVTADDPTEESTIQIPLVTLLINDTGSRKNLQNQATPLPCMAGSGERPYRLIKPRLFQAASTINFSWAYYGAGTITYANIYLTLHGFTKPAGT